MSIESIDSISLNLTPQVGEKDALLMLRVVPDGREGKTVYARTLRSGEVDTGEAVILDRTKGEQLRFRPGAIEVTLRVVDEFLSRRPTGQHSISLTLLTWLTLARPKNEALVRYLQAVGRRLDVAAELLLEIHRGMAAPHDSAVAQGGHMLRSLSLAELVIVAFGRTVDMLVPMKDVFSVSTMLPAALASKADAIRAMRNAFEHIEDRAFGNERGKPHPEALTVFDQRAFFEGGIISYGSHSLDMRVELPELFALARAYICAVASEVGGYVRTAQDEVSFFGGDP